MAGETSSILRGAGAALLVHALATSAVAAGTRTAAGRAESEQRVASAPGAAAPGDTPPEEPRIPLEARTGLARPPVLPEATLAEAQAAAARLAAGSTADDESRLSRARSSHWAPLLRAQLGSTDTARSRTGQQLASPVRWDEQGAGRTWSVAATWDLGQLIFNRDESHLALLKDWYRDA